MLFKVDFEKYIIQLVGNNRITIWGILGVSSKMKEFA